MKVVFLDIDGVLNSWKYDQERTSLQDNIDETRLPLLKEIVDMTQAKIVLTSSWRKHWDPKGVLTDEIDKCLELTFNKYHISLFDKTIEIDDFNRAEEIRSWLKKWPVEEFVILDDIAFGWADLSNHLVKTNYRIGRGLNDKHVSLAISILNGERNVQE